VVIYNFNGTNSDELTLYENEYIMVTDWNIGNGYAFGYKVNDPQRKGKFPSSYVYKYSENKEMNSQYTLPINDQSYFQQMDQSSLLSENSALISITSLPSITPSIQQRPTAPLDFLDEDQIHLPKTKRSSMLSKISSRFSISSSPSIISLFQQRPTAPSETSLKYRYDNKNFENN